MGAVERANQRRCDRHGQKPIAIFLVNRGRQAAVYKPLLDVRPEYLDSGFDEVKDRYGSFTSYEKKALGLDAKEIKKLKSALLSS